MLISRHLINATCVQGLMPTVFTESRKRLHMFYICCLIPQLSVLSRSLLLHLFPFQTFLSVHFKDCCGPSDTFRPFVCSFFSVQSISCNSRPALQELMQYLDEYMQRYVEENGLLPR